MSTDLPGHRPDGPGGDALGGIPGDLLGDIVSSEPGLDALLGMLTAGAAPGELAGENAALAMFRASRRPAAPPPGHDAPDPGTARTAAFAPGPHPSRAARHGRPARRAGLITAAVTLAAAAGFAVAAYTEALPAPLQRAAYHALGFAGVPAARHSAPGAAPSHPPGHARQPGAAPTPGRSQQAAAPASPQPSTPGRTPAGPSTLSITVAGGRIIAGQGDTFSGRLTGRSGAVQGAILNLLERAAGQPGWHLAGTATTGRNGSAVVTVLDLTTNAAFRLEGPGGTQSRAVLVIVVPPVSASVSSSGPRADTVTASSPLAAAGDTAVLQILSGAHWLRLQAGRLDSSGQAGFQVPLRARQRMYRVVLLPTASHGMSVSNAVAVPPR
jgi:hypothetical protein